MTYLLATTFQQQGPMVLGSVSMLAQDYSSEPAPQRGKLAFLRKEKPTE